MQRSSSAAVISVSYDGHCIVEYCESKSPVGLGISRYGDLPKIVDLLDLSIGDMNRHTSIRESLVAKKPAIDSHSHFPDLSREI